MQQINTLSDWLQSMKFEDFINWWCYLWNPDTGKNEPWQLWPKQYEMVRMMESCKRLFLPKARQIGGSKIAGTYCVKVALQEPNSRILVISKTEGDAKDFLKYQIKTVLETLPPVEGINWGSWEMLQEKVNFSNGTTLDCLTTSEDAGRGSTTRLVIMDEASAIEHARQIWKSVNSTIDQITKGQIIVISNSKNGTWFNEQLSRINDGKVKGISLYFLNTWTDPKRDQAWKEQMITQYDNEVDFYTEYPETIEHMFLTREGAVFPTFDPHEGGRHVNAFEPDWANRYIYLYDHGFVHYSVFLLCLYNPFEDHLFILDELFAAEKDLEMLSKDINKKIYYWRSMGAPHYAWKRIADRSCFAKKGQKTVSDLLRIYTGISFSKSFSHNEEASLDLVRGRFTKGRITIHSRCRETIRQCRDLKHDKHGNPEDKENDSTDLLRYISAELNQEQRPVAPPPRKKYSQDFTEHKKRLANLFAPGGGAAYTEKKATSWQSA